jgi:hypothetical protein
MKSKKQNSQMSKISFIKNVLIGEIGPFSKQSPYLSFVLMVSAFECIGNMIPGRSKKSGFERSFLTLSSLKKYKVYFKKYKLKENLSDSFKFYFKPGENIIVTSNSKKHLKLSGKSLIIDSEYFFKDLKSACIEVSKKIKDKNSNFINIK